MTQGRRQSWYGVAGAGALLLLTSEAALILLGPLVLFTVFTARGRAALDRIGPWIAIVVLVGVLFVHLLWLEGASDSLTPVIARLHNAGIAGPNTILWLRLLIMVALAHAGVVILAGLAAGWPRTGTGPLPALKRGAVDDFARSYIKVFAVVPALLSTILTVVLGRTLPIGGVAPLVTLSGLAVVVVAGDVIVLYHQRILGFAWAGLLLVPALMVPAVIIALPWTLGTDLTVAEPASAMGRFFADYLRQPDRASARRRHWGNQHRRHGRAGGAEPAERLFRGRSGALAIGHARHHTEERRCGAVDHAGYQPGAAARHQGAVPRSGPRSAASVRAPHPGPDAAVARRLGDDPAGTGRGGGAAAVGTTGAAPLTTDSCGLPPRSGGALTCSRAPPTYNRRPSAEGESHE